MKRRDEDTRMIVSQWLNGEDAYQWARSDGGKFKIQDDVDGLYPGSAFPWEQMFLDRWGRFRLFHKAEAYQHAIQHMGKLAAGGRVLYVTLQIAQKGKPYEDHFEAINDDSLKKLQRLIEAPATIESIDWHEDNFAKNAFGQTFAALHLPLEPEKEITDSLIDESRNLYVTGFDLFVAYLRSVRINEVAVPRPGLPSGQMDNWDY